MLGSPRIVLPPAASTDIRSGQVHESVLAAMLALSSTFTIGVSVLRSGHPITVFATSHLIDATRRSLVTAFMKAAAPLGSYNVGGPYLLGGATYFSDDTHHDHVHAGFTT